MRIVFALLLLGGCATHPVAKSAAQQKPQPLDFCSNAKPIRITKGDRLSPGTADAIIAHNNTGKTLCGWKP